MTSWGSAKAASEGHTTGVVKPTITQLSPNIFDGSPRIEEYTLPTPYAGPFGMAIDPDGIIWITLNAENALGRFDPTTNEYREYRIPSTKDLPKVDWEYDSKNRTTPEETVTNYSTGNPGSVTVAPDGAIWMVAILGNSILRFDAGKEEFTEFLLPTPNTQPYDLAVASDGKVWFALKNHSSFGYLDPDREKIVEIPLPNGAQSMGIAIDKEGNIWIGDVRGNVIGRYQPESKTFRSFTINTHLAQPGMMRFDDAGRLWFCQMRTKQLGVLIPDPGIFSVVDIPGYNTTPQALAVASDDIIWVADSMMNRIGRFDMAELSWTMFDIHTANSQPMDIEIDASGDVWFTENDRNANKIARLVVSTIKSPVVAAVPSNIRQDEPTSSGMPGGVAMVAVLALLIGLGAWGWKRRTRKQA